MAPVTLAGGGAINDLPAAERPIFVFAQHRGGSTLMLRLLNRHPGVVIWGEHAGFINQLADADQVLAGYRAMLGPRPEETFARFLASDDASMTENVPWVSPLTAHDFPSWSRKLIREVFCRRVRPDQRWGFKEIRYQRPLVAAFLARLFPAAQFIVLTREPVELCVSNILVPWALKHLLARQVRYDLTEVLQIVEDCLYAIVAMQTNMAAIHQALPDRTIALTYDELIADAPGTIDRLLAFLSLGQTAAVQAAMLGVIGRVEGRTEKQTPVLDPDGRLGLLTPELVRAMAANLLPRVRESIASDGIDLVRLRRLGTRGRYSYLLGDHELSERGSSSMF
jgi:hypothetical protein